MKTVAECFKYADKIGAEVGWTILMQNCFRRTNRLDKH